MIIADPDGDGPLPQALIAGGQFGLIGNARARSTAYWTPDTGWVPMGNITGSAENVFSFATLNGQLFVGGGFSGLNPIDAPGTQPRNVAVYDGTRWQPMSASNGVPGFGTVQSLAPFNGSLYALVRDGSAPNMLSRYTPGPTLQTGTWSTLVANLNGSGVQLLEFDGALYLLGNFNRTATPSTRFQVARLNTLGNDVVELPAISGGSVAGGVVFNNALYVFGSFSQGVLKLDTAANAWIPSTTDASVGQVASLDHRAAAVLGNELIVGNTSFNQPSKVLSLSGVWSTPPTNAPTQNYGQITPIAMAALPSNLSPTPSLAIGASGSFAGTDNTSAYRLARWDRTTNQYSTFSAGFSDAGFGYPFVNAAAVFNGELYLGGSFYGAGSQRSRNLAKWNGTTLTDVPQFSTTEVTRLFADAASNRLYIATISSLAAFDGTTVSVPTDSAGGSYATGVSSVNAMTTYNADLVVGGGFNGSTGRPSFLMRRSGTTWENFGSASPNASVSALTTWSSPLISGGANLLVAAGSFTQINTNPPTPAKVAAWDGSTWRALGQSTLAASTSNAPVSLFVHNNDLYMAAYFTMFNGVSDFPYLARYQPASDTWTAIPRPPNTVASGFGQPVRAISAAGAIWLTARGVGLPQLQDQAGLLRWDGSTWTALGGIAAGFAQTTDLTFYNGDLVMTGLFGVVGTQLPPNPLPNITYTGVGGVVSVGWARLQVGSTSAPTITTEPVSRQVSTNCSTAFTVQGATNSPPLSYAWQFRPLGSTDPFSDVAPGSNAAGRFSASGQNTPTITLSNVLPGPSLEFRAIVSDACGSTTSNAASLQSCIADYNCSGGGSVTVQDVFDFLADWFNGAPRADVNAVGGVTVQDVFDFLVAWFNGC